MEHWEGKGGEGWIVLPTSRHRGFLFTIFPAADNVPLSHCPDPGYRAHLCLWTAVVLWPWSWRLWWQLPDPRITAMWWHSIPIPWSPRCGRDSSIPGGPARGVAMEVILKGPARGLPSTFLTILYTLTLLFWIAFSFQSLDFYFFIIFTWNVADALGLRNWTSSFLLNFAMLLFQIIGSIYTTTCMRSCFLTTSTTFEIVLLRLLLPLLLFPSRTIIICQSDDCKRANCCLYLSVLIIC